MRFWRQLTLTFSLESNFRISTRHPLGERYRLAAQQTLRGRMIIFITACIATWRCLCAGEDWTVLLVTKITDIWQDVLQSFENVTGVRVFDSQCSLVRSIQKRRKLSAQLYGFQILIHLKTKTSWLKLSHYCLAQVCGRNGAISRQTDRQTNKQTDRQNRLQYRANCVSVQSKSDLQQTSLLGRFTLCKANRYIWSPSRFGGLTCTDDKSGENRSAVWERGSPGNCCYLILDDAVCML